MSSIELDGKGLHEAVTVAIMQSLTPETREKLIGNAICELLDPSRDNHNGLRRIFNDAVAYVARKIIEEQLAADAQFIQRVSALVTDATTKAMGPENRSKLVDQLASGISRALYGDRY